ncbi:MAG: TolB family protein [Ignavibacteriales bacterium]
MFRISLLLVIISNFIIAQEISWVTIVAGNDAKTIPAYNYHGSVYLSVQFFAESLNRRYKLSDDRKHIEIDFEEVKIELTANNPFVKIFSKLSNESETFQSPTSSHFIDELIFLPLEETLDLFNTYGKELIIINSPNRLMVLPQEQNQVTIIENIVVDDNQNGTFIKISSNDKILTHLTDESGDSFTMRIQKSSIQEKDFSSISSSGLVKNLAIANVDGDVEIKVKKISPEITFEFFNSFNGNDLIIHLFERVQSSWLERESEHFKVIYRENHAHLVNYILVSAENSFRLLSNLFKYETHDKIIITTYDVSDYGMAATSTTPQNFIRLEIEPLEPGYEVIPYNERIQWLLTHEIVHVIINDSEAGAESFFRKMFRKVPPEKTQPLSVPYSLLTNYNRYSPRWHQESIAVFFETWLSGGYGRELGSFDEMYFRNLVAEKKKFPSQLDLETLLSHNSMFLENNFYTYGGRFVGYMAIEYGEEKVLDWFRTDEDDAYEGFEGRFNKVFQIDFDKAWDNFINYEIDFQNKNLEILSQSEFTQLKNLSNEKFGWVSKAYIDQKTNSVIYSHHKPHELAKLQNLNLSSGVSEKIISLPTPSMLQVSSLAFDESNKILFYTTNNNQLFRDIWAYDFEKKSEKILFKDARVGDLTISPVTQDLWGIRHNAGFATICVSRFPYEEITPLVTLALEDEIFNIAVDKDGKHLTAVIKKSNGQQSIIYFEAADLLERSEFNYKIISNSGSPENPSWSKDGNFLYWNAYTNGVSNIYRFDFNNSSIKALTHCSSGLFKPIEITPDSIFAFEFSLDGFKPVIFKNEPAEYLPAINYLGQSVLEKNSNLYNWTLTKDSLDSTPLDFSKELGYNGLSNLHIHSIIPVVSGFQNQVVFGLFTRISDPLMIHDFYMEAGVSPLNEKPSSPLWHLRFKYDYNQLFYVDVLYNGADFFDLFNERKRGMIGTQFKLGHTYYWKYDNPLKIKQATTLTFYRDVQFINDNLVPVSQPDFAVLATNTNLKNLRRSIGSSDFEQGNEINWTATLYGTEFDQPEFAVNTYLEVSDFSTWLWNHNVFHVKIAGGYLWDNENLVQSRYYFGGFGNRGVDNDDIKQFRRVFRFPGIPIYSLITDRFGKIMLENDFPPIRVSDWLLLDQFVNHFDFSVYSQGLITKMDLENYWIDLGAQMDVKLKHWYNLESTISAGIAKAWSLPNGLNDWEWFVSIKLLKD